MPGDLIIHVSWRLQDAPLLASTAVEYEAAVERGDMTEQEAMENYEALYLGMAEIVFE